jgi:N-acetylglucosamine-6-phosphate deacetylase
MTGLEGRVGALTPGRLADITVLSPQGEVRAMLLRGKQVFPAR